MSEINTEKIGIHKRAPRKVATRTVCLWQVTLRQIREDKTPPKLYDILFNFVWAGKNRYWTFSARHDVNLSENIFIKRIWKGFFRALFQYSSSNDFFRTISTWFIAKNKLLNCIIARIRRNNCQKHKSVTLCMILTGFANFLYIYRFNTF